MNKRHTYREGDYKGEIQQRRDGWREDERPGIRDWQISVVVVGTGWQQI